MIGKRLYHRPGGAAVIAGVLMLLFGWTYRTLAIRLGVRPSTILIAPDALEGIPMRIAGWAGEDVPLDEAVARRTGTDACINRRYSRGGESVSLYVGCGTRLRDMLPHRPEGCYIGAGWTRTGRSFRQLSLGSGAVLPCAVIEFSRGGLNTTKIVVVHYYVVDGRFCQTDREWRYRHWRIGYVAQVEIVTSVTEVLSADEAARIACDFAVDSAPLIAQQCEKTGDCVDANSAPALWEPRDH
ncbi:MAG: exosortase-associated EpsI family protein [Phycisphaerae bacterium]|nr:exosortase-associated EpsI family protein [Phycisphaerae bacterium]